jgi:hypothetical protein
MGAERAVVEVDAEVFRELVDALKSKAERDERMIRALETIAQNEQRKLNHQENQRAKALAKSGTSPVTQKDIDQVQARLAKRRGTK